ncbi:MAG: hypothetical protein KAQ68_04170 [Clostridiales bacterium]|nr:hypothetical protein [Clostridiales bacterium]
MNQIIELVRKKSHLLVVINSIEKYIKNKYFDENLRQVWDEYNKELETIDAKLAGMDIPALEEFENEKLKLRKQIHGLEEELGKCNQQVKELNQIAANLK